VENFLKSFFGDQKLELQKMSGDAGHRSYMRIQNQGQDSYVLMLSGAQDQSLKDFVAIHKRLKQGKCLVPKLFKQDFAKGFLLMEDLHSQELNQVAPKNSRTYYLKAIQQLLYIQQITVQKTDVQFNESFLKQEVDLGIKHLTMFLKDKMPQNEFFKKEMDDVISKIVQAPFVFCHRDFHSKNLMIYKDDIYLLDFQDAVAAPWMYDLASLVYDSYISFSDAQREDLINFYFKNSSFKSDKNLIDFQFLQRGFKACTWFVKFYNENQRTTHLKYIQPTLHNLYKIANKSGYIYMANFFKELKSCSFDTRDLV